MSLLLRNARVVGGAPTPVDVLLKHGVIRGIGVASDGSALAGTAELDLAGRFILPGLWDDHVHLGQLALTSRRVDVSGATSAVHLAKLMAGAPRPEAGLPLVGFGFRDGLWPDRPSSALLDLPGDPPVVVVSGDLHSCWLNAAAARRFGVEAGESGMVREHDAFPVISALQSVPAEVLDTWVSECAQAAARRGVVGVVDFEMGETVVDWTRRFTKGFRQLRVAAAVYAPQLEAAIAAGHRTGAEIDGSDGRLTVGPHKLIADGSLNTRTALCADAYPGMLGAEAHGQALMTPAALVSALRRASGAGFVPAVHAIGDEANRLALDAFEEVGCSGRIEHAQLLLDADVSRFAALGVTASAQPEQAMDDRDVADRYWAGRTGRAFPLRALLDAGADLVLGSDAPVAPLDPWVTAAAAVGRARDGREPWHPEQSITNAEALAASAHGRRRLEVGHIADLAVVELDPLTATHEELRAMPVAATMIAGYFTHNDL